MSQLDVVWSDPMWREAFRLAYGSTAKPVLGFVPALPVVVDPFDFDWCLANCNGEQFGASCVGVFRVDLGHVGRHFLLITGRCECTIGNGNDRWDLDCKVDVQVAPTLEALVRLAMGDDDRARLGY